MTLAASTGDAFSIPQQRTDLSRRAGDQPGPLVLMRTMPPAVASANPALPLASLDWLTRHDSLLAIAPKPPAAVALPLTGDAPDWNVLIGLPLPLLAILAAGLLVLVRPRRRPA